MYVRLGFLRHQGSPPDFRQTAAARALRIRLGGLLILALVIFGAYWGVHDLHYTLTKSLIVVLAGSAACALLFTGLRKRHG